MCTYRQTCMHLFLRSSLPECSHFVTLNWPLAQYRPPIVEDGLDGHGCCLLIGAGHPDTVYIDIVAVCCLMLAAGFCVLLKQIL